MSGRIKDRHGRIISQAGGGGEGYEKRGRSREAGTGSEGGRMPQVGRRSGRVSQCTAAPGRRSKLSTLKTCTYLNKL